MNNNRSYRFAEMCAAVTEYARPETLKNMRWPRLKRLLQHAYANVPAYSKHYRKFGVDLSAIRSEKDLHLLPPISKSVFKEYEANGIAGYAEIISAARRIGGVTSGSTGEPFHYYIDGFYNIEKEVLRYRNWRRAGANPLAPKILCAPESTNLMMPNLIFFNPHSIRRKKEEYIRVIRDSGVKFLFGFPLLVFDLLWMLASEGITDITFDAAIVSGHVVSPGVRSFIKNNFGCAVFDYYGAGEIGPIAAECEMHKGLHIQEENTIVEIVDAYGKPVPPGTAGRVLITTLSNEVMPFIRYDIGDIGAIIPGVCPCKRTSRRMLLEGRSNEYLLMGVNGEIISPSMLRDILDRYFEYFKRYQVVQKDLKTLVINIVPAPAYQKNLEREIITRVHEMVGYPISVSFRYVDDIVPLKSGKFQYFISDLWQRRFPESMFKNQQLKERLLNL